jgi:hypothetical protein
MLKRVALVFAVAATLLLSLHAGAADKKDKYLINPNDNIKTILEKEIDLPVKLRLKSGAELSGTVARVGNGVVQIAEIGGMEFYDAVVNIDGISAVLFKVRKR